MNIFELIGGLHAMRRFGASSFHVGQHWLSVLLPDGTFFRIEEIDHDQYRLRAIKDCQTVSNMTLTAEELQKAFG